MNWTEIILETHKHAAIGIGINEVEHILTTFLELLITHGARRTPIGSFTVKRRAPRAYRTPQKIVFTEGRPHLKHTPKRSCSQKKES